MLNRQTDILLSCEKRECRSVIRHSIPVVTVRATFALPLNLTLSLQTLLKNRSIFEGKVFFYPRYTFIQYGGPEPKMHLGGR